jgi:hypothetical protein
VTERHNNRGEPVDINNVKIENTHSYDKAAKESKGVEPTRTTGSDGEERWISHPPGWTTGEG